MKTKEELNALKEEVEALNNKLCELTTEELEQVTGGKLDYEAYQWWKRNGQEIVKTSQTERQLPESSKNCTKLSFKPQHFYTGKGEASVGSPC